MARVSELRGVINPKAALSGYNVAKSRCDLAGPFKNCHQEFHTPYWLKLMDWVVSVIFVTTHMIKEVLDLI